MNRTFRIKTARILGPLVLGTTLLIAGAAKADPAGKDDDAAMLVSKLRSMLGKPGGLTADVVATRAEATSFDVQSKREDIEAAAAQVDQALVAYFPRLNLSGRYTRLSPLDPPSLGYLVSTRPDVGPGEIPTGTPLYNQPFSFPILLNQTIFQATLTVPISDYVLRISQGYAAASKSEKAAKLSEGATRLKAATDARIAYYTWVRAKLQEVVAEEALAQVNAHLVDSQHAFDAGTVSKADVLRVQSQVASNRLLVERAKSLSEVTETQIRVAMHDAAPMAYEIGEPIEGEHPKVQGADNLAALWAEAGAARLELKTFEQTSDALLEQAKVARAGNLPRLDAFGDVMYSNPNQRIFPQQNAFKATWDVGLSLTYAPNDIALAGASNRNLKARASSIIAQKQAAEDGIRVEVTQARNALREAEAAIESTAQGLVAAEESYRVRRSLFRNGRATGVEVTDAQTDLTRSRLEAIHARVDVRIAVVRLEHAVGRDVARISR